MLALVVGRVKIDPAVARHTHQVTQHSICSPTCRPKVPLSLGDLDLGSMGLPILSVWRRAKGGAESPDYSYFPGLQETQSLKGSGAGTGSGRLKGPRVTSGQGQLEGSRIQMLQLLMTGPRQCLPHLLIHEDRSRMGATRQLTQPRSATSSQDEHIGCSLRPCERLLSETCL